MRLDKCCCRTGGFLRAGIVPSLHSFGLSAGENVQDFQVIPSSQMLVLENRDTANNVEITLFYRSTASSLHFSHEQGPDCRTTDLPYEIAMPYLPPST